ncbi:hypothetical protein [Nafulsella turpanensis]|uniref:hypothetical protein n=1 Tax=Nafulsella turpanensis TaxID=1265690 RepID=UPI00034B4A17|nr:hypothetical protein [Nafulsella turpanensis]
MDPITIISLAQGGIGLAQMAGGALTKTPKRPEYKPAAAIVEAEQTAERESNASLMPGYAQAQQGIQQSAANALQNVTKTAQSSGDILNSVGGIQGMQNRSLSDLVRMNMQDKARRKAVHMQSLGALAGEQQRAFQYNEAEPYQNAIQTKSALFGGGLQTLSDAAANYSAYAQMKQGQPQQKEVTHLPAAPAPVGYTLSDMVNNSEAMLISNLLKRVNGYNNQF